MAPSKNAERDAREARERLRRYSARQAVHGAQVTRRRRDNLIAIIGVLVVVALATVTQVFYFTAGPGTPTATPSPAATAVAGANSGDVPAKSLAESRTWTGSLTLNKVKLGIELDGAKAPQATSVFVDLTKKGFYTKTGDTCHRLTTGDTLKVIQCGSIDSNGSSGPGFFFGPLENVPVDGVYPAGTIAMARSTDPYSQGSQFFITYADSTLDTAATGGGYTVVGHVTSGLDTLVSDIASAGVADGSTDGAPAIATKITQASVK
ncbi:MAG: peptidylprolyl isomerase [Microbacteriaceae bacterium]|nr:peptidylprolyl isomerase [Microbacteriaceae bacterium]